MVVVVAAAEVILRRVVLVDLAVAVQEALGPVPTEQAELQT
jgi:hypothetical protein